ncbi:MAG: SPOR domain-containing protein [Campylobacterales bacterium]|nr:SPOR domain-containing protein [Campylobacterales bacterium]
MNKSTKFLISTAAIAFLVSGCVKPTDTIVASTDSNGVIYEGATTTGAYQPSVITEGETVVYPSASSGTVYTTDGSEVSSGAYTSTTPGLYNSANGAYGNPTTYETNSVYTSSGVYTTPSDYSAETTYAGQSETGGIQLQVAAYSNAALAEQKRAELSLDPKYRTFVEPSGNGYYRLLIEGFTSRAEAEELKNRQFPNGLVKGSTPSTVSSATSTYSNTSSTVGSGSVGIQVGAYSSYDAAQSAAQSVAAGRPVKVNTGNLNGKTIYKGIVLGFTSYNDAKNALATGQFGNGFVVTNP